MKVIEHGRNTHEAVLSVKSGFSKKVLLISDIHYDSVGCNRDLLKKHFDEAKESDALIIINGDWFDLMQGKYDPRKSYNNLRPEYKSETYIDDVVMDSVNFLSNYVDNILLIGWGNHETNIIKRQGTDPIQSLINILNYKYPDQKIYKGGYSGFIKFRFTRDGTNTLTSYSKLIKYHHGQRGNAQRSKGILQADIDSAKWPDADIVIKGDDHMKWYLPSMVRQRINSNMKIYESVQHHIRLGSYLDGLGIDEYEGWGVEKSFQRTKAGGWWLNFTYINDSIKISVSEAD